MLIGKKKKNISQQHQSWRSLVRRNSVLDESGASGIHIFYCSGLAVLQVICGMSVSLLGCLFNLEHRNCLIYLSSVPGKFICPSKPKSREEQQRTVWEDNSPWIAPVSACHGSEALTTLCSF